MVDINNPANYKACKKKQFEVWMCRPPVGTVVVDHLTQTRGSSGLKKLGFNGNILTVEMLRKLKATDAARFNMVMQAVQNGLISMVRSAEQVVLCGTEGQCYITDYSFVRSQYSVFSNNAYVSLDAVPELRQDLFDWRRVRANSEYASRTVACFVPVQQTFVLGSQIVNEKGIPHGKGDFIVCSKLVNGAPDLSHRWVVNGLIFSDTYNNQGWQEYIQIGRQGMIDRPPSVVVDDICKDETSLMPVLGRLFSIPVVRKASRGSQYRFDIPGSYFMIEQKDAKTRFSTGDGFSKVVSISSANDIKKWLQNARVYYEFMYMSLVEQFKADGMLVDADFGPVYREFVKKCRIVAHYDALKAIYVMFKQSGLKLRGIELPTVLTAEYVDNETRYLFSDEFVSIDMMLTSDNCLFFLGYGLDDCSEYSFDGEPYEDYCDRVAGSGYSNFRAVFMRTYETLKSSVKDSTGTIYLYRLRDQGVSDDVLDKLAEFFDVNENKVALRRCFHIISWANECGRVTTAYASDDEVQCLFDYENDEYSVSVYAKAVVNDAEYTVSKMDNDMRSRSVVYRDVQSFRSALKQLKNASKDEDSVLDGGDDFFFFVDSGIVGFGSKRDDLLIMTDFDNDTSVYREVLNMSSVFSTLYLNHDIPCYTLDADSEDMFDKMCRAADNVALDEFVLKVYGVLDDIALRAGYKIRTYPEKRVGNLDRTAPKFELVERNSVTGHVKGYVYNPAFNVKMPFSCSSTTWRALEVWQGVFQCPVVGTKFHKLHYHQLQLRAGNYLNLYDFKSLRLAYLKENDRCFGGVLSRYLVVGACNYNGSFDGDDSYGAVHCNAYPLILVNAKSYMLQGTRDGVSDPVRSTLIHEMCHEYTEYKYGTCLEKAGETGVEMYGLSRERYGYQVMYHGKHFGEAIQLAANASGIPFDDLFSYGYGHQSLRYNSTSSDRNLNVTGVALALDNGAPYRAFEEFRGDLFMCKVCGSVYSYQKVCHGVATVSIGAGSFVTRCHSCGDIKVYADSRHVPGDIGSGYYSSIDIVGLLSTQKCSKCGGSLESLAPGLDHKDYVSYMSDFRYTNKYKHHFYAVASKTLDKYNKWFRRVAECEVSLSCGEMPYILFTIKGEYFEEYYKLFFSSGKGDMITGALYRDYGINSKGYRIHKFRLRTDTDIVKFMDYFMSYVRRDFKTT